MVNRKFEMELSRLNDNFETVTGRRFQYFYCPILQRDDDVPLCEGHIINQAFPNSPDIWVVQRCDVDNTFGSIVEADFTDLRYLDHPDEDFFTDPSVSKRFRTVISAGNEIIENYVVNNNPIPNAFTALDLEFINGQQVLYGLKMTNADVEERIKEPWFIEISKDVSLSTQISLIKAAHLTLFKLMDYRYALSASGSFVGRDILGAFYKLCVDDKGRQKKDRSTIIEQGKKMFEEFRHVVRPVELDPQLNLKGTLEDGNVLIIFSQQQTAWGIIVFIKLVQRFHAVLIPILHNDEAAALYLEFLKNSQTNIEVKLCRIEPDRWICDTRSHAIVWTK